MKKRSAIYALALGAGFVACGGAPPAGPAQGTEPLAAPASTPSTPSAGASAPASTAAPIAAAPPSATAAAVAPASSPAPSPIEVRFVREVEGAVTAIALEKPPHAAAIGPSRLWIHDARGWHDEALPRSLRKEPPLETSVFFGRDDRVRVVASSAGADAESVYLRGKKGGGLAPEPGEIGRLGTTRGGLVAVLGTVDPEIVCRPTDLCIVKRRSGWTMFPSPPTIRRVTLAGEQGWGVADRALLRLGDGKWEEVGSAGTWEISDHLFASPVTGAAPPDVWVIETAKDRLHRFDGTAWTVIPSPVERPRAIWGADARALWLVGDSGLALFEAGAWRAAPDAPHPLAAVAGRSADDVWIAGASGVYRVERPPPKVP